MKILKDKKGRISLIELIVIIFLVIEGFYLVTKGFGWYSDKATHGDDSFLVNTADSTARVNSLNGQCCPVSDCGSHSDCVHLKGEYYVGYFDDTTHHIVAYPPKGYNQNQEMHIGEKIYHGDPGTMVIEIRCRNGEIILDWVKAR